MGIVEYAENQMERFGTAKFNSVDSLALSQFAYIYFNDVVPGLDDQAAPVRIADLLKAEYIARMLHNVRDPKSNHRLLLALGMNPRPVLWAFQKWVQGKALAVALPANVCPVGTSA